MRRRTASRYLTASVLAAALLAASCAPSSSGAAEIAVGLDDTSITLDAGSAPAGTVVFATTNTSSSLVHEIEVFSGATTGSTLPIASGVADTNGLHLVDEIEDILPGATVSLTVDLAPGTYLVVCNLPGHYALGMWTHLEVTPEG